MKALTRTHADTAGDRVLPVEVVEVLRQREIGEPIAVVREEDGIVPEITPHGVETLADVGVQTGVGEGDRPSRDVTAVYSDVHASSEELEVVRQALVVVEEVSLDEIATITETENELGVAEVRVVLHEMPDDRAVADVHHRLRYRLRVLPQPGSKPTAKEDNLHRNILNGAERLPRTRRRLGPCRRSASLEVAPRASSRLGSAGTARPAAGRPDVLLATLHRRRSAPGPSRRHA